MKVNLLTAVVFSLAYACPNLSLAQTPVTYEQALEKVAGAIGERLMASSQRSATVLDFTNQESIPTQLGNLVAQDLLDKLVPRVNRITWVDRTQRDFVIKENRFVADRLMDPTTRKKLGNLIGVDTIVVGTVILLGRQVRMQARAIDIDTARVLAIDSATFQLPDSMAGLADRSISSSSEAASATRSEPAGTTFRNRVLAVYSRNLTITPDNINNVVPTATFEVENISGQDVWVGITRVMIGPCMVSAFAWNKVSGVEVLFESAVGEMTREKSVARRNRLTAVPAGGKIVVVASGSGTCQREQAGAFRGKSTSVAITFVLDYAESFQRFSAGISDFPITSNSYPSN